MMRSNERRKLIMECLSFRRYDTIQHLADEFGVSTDTISRDIKILEEEFPITTTRGKGGGVTLPNGYYISQKHLTPKQTAALKRAISVVCEIDREILESIFFSFAW